MAFTVADPPCSTHLPPCSPPPLYPFHPLCAVHIFERSSHKKGDQSEFCVGFCLTSFALHGLTCPGIRRDQPGQNCNSIHAITSSSDEINRLPHQEGNTQSVGRLLRSLFAILMAFKVQPECGNVWSNEMIGVA